jgi:UPF0755 protein
MSKKRSWKKILLYAFLVILLCGAGGAWYVWRLIYGHNVSVDEVKYLFIPTGATYEDVVLLLEKEKFVKDIHSFDLVAKRKKYPEKVKPGRYLIVDKMSNNDLVNKLRIGDQEPVKITFTSVRWKDQLITRVCSQLEADSTEMTKKLDDSTYLAKNFGMRPDNILTMFIPNTYELYWNTSVDDFMKRMAGEYKKFWTEARKKKAKDAGLTQTQVSILASIVQEEQHRFNDEKAVIAGLYLNRMKKDHALESDPTLLYAMGDFSIQRVLNKDKDVESPYNTYKYKGLPPGPINIPDISSLDAVLNYQSSDYFFMCAKEDFSGRHNFAVTYAQHLANARKYQKALSKRGINR